MGIDGRWGTADVSCFVTVDTVAEARSIEDMQFSARLRIMRASG